MCTQVGFFEVIVMPFFNTFTKMFPKCKPLRDMAHSNLETWKQNPGPATITWKGVCENKLNDSCRDMERERGEIARRARNSNAEGDGAHEKEKRRCIVLTIADLQEENEYERRNTIT